MWHNEFTMDMLTGCSRIVVSCPSHELEREFATLLDEHGVTYPNGKSLLTGTKVWEDYGEDFCYYIEGKTARRGPKRSTESFPWNRYEKYTFQGELQDDTEIDDDSFFSIIGR